MPKYILFSIMYAQKHLLIQCVTLRNKVGVTNNNMFPNDDSILIFRGALYWAHIIESFSHLAPNVKTILRKQS